MKKYRRQYEHLFGKGWSGGYTEYRYGRKKQVTLAEPSILAGAKRDHVVKQTAELLRTWTLNRWESEAPVRHGLRTGLVLQGHGWQRSDDQAADIVRRAFNRLGRGVETRPSDDEASFGHDDRKRCAVCYAPLDKQSVAMGLRYCCPDHARFALERREYADGWYNSELGTAAYRMVLRERNEARDCRQCGRPFKPMDLNSTQQYCSPSCKAESQMVEYPPRVCDLPACEEVFTPTARNPMQKYCCHKHALEAKKTREAQQCARPGCGNWFVSSHNNATEGGRRGLYCSRECADAMRGEVRHELVCQCCGDLFVAAMPNATACCNAHYQILRKFEKGQPPKRLSAPVFDYLFYREQAPQERSPIQMLFDAAA